jgi:5-amino-6-(5-phosphoribosylamino)uracil reductase/diaminohydroxyphosphoribosylaminopyrimidine deaminase/5-amino-6-(5-phosphoribosylamino)uracil reductase
MARPEVTLIYAQSLDGRIALLGKRTQLSSHSGLVLAHRCRAESDAVLVGSGTVKIDNPQLSVRFVSGSQPKRVILSSHLDVPVSARVFKNAPGVLVVGAKGMADKARLRELEKVGAEVRLVNLNAKNTIELSEALEVIANYGVQKLLVEGGARILSSFIRERLVERVVVELVPVFLGETGVASVGDLAVEHFDDCPSLTDLEVERLDSSVVIRGRLAT